MTMRQAVPPYFDYLIESFRLGKAGRYVHLGHWDAPPAMDAQPQPGEFERAQARLTQVLLGMADLRDGQNVLDVGCGFGGSFELLNRHLRNTSLTGVNIDPRQLDLRTENGGGHRQSTDGRAIDLSLHQGFVKR